MSLHLCELVEPRHDQGITARQVVSSLNSACANINLAHYNRNGADGVLKTLPKIVFKQDEVPVTGAIRNVLVLTAFDSLPKYFESIIVAGYGDQDWWTHALDAAGYKYKSLKHMDLSDDKVKYGLEQVACDLFILDPFCYEALPEGRSGLLKWTALMAQCFRNSLSVLKFVEAQDYVIRFNGVAEADTLNSLNDWISGRYFRGIYNSGLSPRFDAYLFVSSGGNTGEFLATLNYLAINSVRRSGELATSQVIRNSVKKALGVFPSAPKNKKTGKSVSEGHRLYYVPK